MKKHIACINENEIREIKFVFNLPSSPHMGGACKRLVQSIKTNLFKILPIKIPSDELLRACLMEVTNIVNSRPLTYIPIEPETMEALTPTHFLVGSSTGIKPVGKFDDKVLLLRKNWQISQKVTDNFWKRWVSEYGPTLTRRTKWFRDTPSLQKGDVVVIFDENCHRNEWPLGRVEDVILSKDGKARQAKIKTGKGQTYFRPVNRKGSNIHQTCS